MKLSLKMRALPYFLRNWVEYRQNNRNPNFQIRLGDIHFRTADRFVEAGTARGHYFLQDLWAAQFLYERGVKEQVDVGSRFDGFIAHVLPFCRVVYVDTRPLIADLRNLEFRQGSLFELPFGDDAVHSLSSLHVLEHAGLGRYGDPVKPDGYILAAAELSRILAPGGILLLSAPVGRERLSFDAHRVFDPNSILDAFSRLVLKEFNLIDDEGLRIRPGASFDAARRCEFGCGLFVFTKTGPQI